MDLIKDRSGMFKQSSKRVYNVSRGVYSGHQIDFGLDVLGRFEIGFWVHIYCFLLSCKLFLKPGQIGFGYKVGYMSGHRFCFEHL